jgi:hypothetical protein
VQKHGLHRGKLGGGLTCLYANGYGSLESAKWRCTIKAASRTTGADARVFWKNLGDKDFLESKSAAFELTSDGEHRTYRIRLADHPAWKGPIVSLRLDPVGTGGKGDWIRIKSIGMEK